jgi:hypothetical protein
MNAQTFNLGTRDFFGALVPGLLFLALLPGSLVDVAKLPELFWLLGSTNDLVNLLLLFGAAYAVGAPLSAAAGLLDEIVDPWAKKRIAQADTDSSVEPAALSKIGREFSRVARREKVAQAFCANLVTSLGGTPETSPWPAKSLCWTLVRQHNPAGHAMLDRIEGNQKLFRSLCVGAILLAVLHFVAGSPVLVPILLLLASAVSLLLYIYQRLWFSHTLYQYTVVGMIPEAALQRATETLLAPPPRP